MHLTELAIQALRTDRPQQTFFDDMLKGFGVRVSKGGTKSYIFMHGNARKLATIGRVEDIGLKAARDEARKLLATRKEEAADLSFREARDQFLAIRVKPNNKRSTAQKTERYLAHHFAILNERPLALLKTADFLGIVNGLVKAGTPSEANHAFAAVRTMLRWSVGQGYIPYSPLQASKLPARPRQRRRVLLDPELAIVLPVARSAGSYGQIIELLVLTGQRLAQIANLRGEWIEADLIRFLTTIGIGMTNAPASRSDLLTG